jgi:hypothetical protein
MALSKIDPDGLNIGQIGGRRNLIINGAMQVAQRGTSSTGVTSNGYYTCDRFKNYISGLGTWSISQSTDAPDGFASSLKLDCTTADASPASSDYLQVAHFIEGQDLQQLQFGSSGAKSLTLSFWVKCNKTGTGRVHFAQPDASYRSIGGSYTISAANTWEQKTITIVGDTSGTINNDNGIGLEIIWWLDSGSNYNSGAMPTAWEADSAADRNAGGTLALGDSTDNEWYITGVQLEVGNVATPFEHRSYGEELALCQRYFIQTEYYGASTSKRTFTQSTGSMTGTNNWLLLGIQLPTEMRAVPSLDFSDLAGNTGKLSLWANTAGGLTDNISSHANYIEKQAFVVSDYFNNKMGIVLGGYKVDAEL